MKKIILLFIISISFQCSIAQNVGIGTLNPTARLHIADSNVLFSAAKDLPLVIANPPASGAGRRMMWYADKGAFRAGLAMVNEWDKDSIGNYSFAAGSNVKAKGIGSFVGGGGSEAIGVYSVALGRYALAMKDYSFAVGYDALANGHGAIAIGDDATALTTYSIAIGADSRASGFSSTAFNSSVAIGNYSSAYGENSVAKAFKSTTIGANNDTIPGASATEWIPTDPLLIVGNGTQFYDRRNALVILKNGFTGIGTSTPAAKLHINGDFSSPVPQLMIEENTNDYARLSFKNANTNNLWTLAGYPHTSTATAQFNIFFQGVGDILKVFGNGNATLMGTLTQNSDSRLKKNVRSVDHSLAALQTLGGYRYEWKDNQRDPSVQIGLLAQEVKQVFPELVHEDEKGTLSVNYSGLIPVLVNAIKEEAQKIEKLETQNKQLLERIERLEKLIL